MTYREERLPLMVDFRNDTLFLDVKMDCGTISAFVRGTESARLASFLVEQKTASESDRFVFITHEYNVQVSILERFIYDGIQKYELEIWISDGVGSCVDVTWVGARSWVTEVEIDSLVAKLRGSGSGSGSEGRER